VRPWLPGRTRDEPNMYGFGKVTYRQIYEDLTAKDPELYRRNGRAWHEVTTCPPRHHVPAMSTTTCSPRDYLPSTPSTPST
jgi:hypothetical protein